MRLKKVEKVYIDARRALDSPKRIAKDLNLDIVDVVNHIEKLKANDAKKEAQFVEHTKPAEESAPPPPTDLSVFVPNVRKLMKTKTDEQGHGGITIMTHEASMLADELKKQTNKKKIPNKAIFVIDPHKKD